MPEVLINQELMTGLVWEKRVETKLVNTSSVDMVCFILKTLVHKWNSFPLVDQNWQNQRSHSVFILVEIQIACQKEIPDR